MRRRKKLGPMCLSPTPIYTASSYFYESMEQLDRIFDRSAGPCYARYDNPRRRRWKKLVTSLEGGHGALACASGMAAMHMAMVTALRTGGSGGGGPRGVRRYGQPADERAGTHGGSGAFHGYLRPGCAAHRRGEVQPACIVMEIISNPLLRVGQIDRIAEIARGPARRWCG